MLSGGWCESFWQGYENPNSHTPNYDIANKKQVLLSAIFRRAYTQSGDQAMTFFSSLVRRIRSMKNRLNRTDCERVRNVNSDQTEFHHSRSDSFGSSDHRRDSPTSLITPQAYARIRAKIHEQFQTQVTVCLVLAMCFVGVKAYSQSLDLFIPDLSIGVHRLSDAANSGRVYLPIYAQNNTGRSLSVAGLNLDLAIDDPSGMLDGGSSQVRLNIQSATLPLSLDELSQAGSNPFIEGQASLNLARTLSLSPNLVFPNTSVSNRAIIFATLSSDFQFDDGRTILLGVIELPITVLDLQSTGSLSFSEFGTGNNLLSLSDNSSEPLVFVSGSEPDGVGTVQVCPSASVSVMQEGMTITETFCRGSSLNFAVSVADNSTPTSFQWFKNGLEIVDGGGISGATSSTLSLPGNQDDVGEYMCEITSPCSTYRSTFQTLEVSAVTITTHPESQTLCDESLELFVEAENSDSEALSYQWLLDGVPISDGSGTIGATSNSLFILDNDVEAGSYTVQVSNGCETIESNPAIITIDEIIITEEPEAQEVCEGETVSFSVSADSLSALRYEWRRNGIPLNNGNGVSGVDTNTLTIAGVSLNDGGLYSCRILNDCFVEATQNTNLIVRSDPVINTIPLDFSTCRGTTRNLFALTDKYTASTGSYTWERFNPGLDAFEVIASGDDFLIGVSFDDEADFTRYRCIVTNPCGSTMSDEIVISELQALTLTRDIQDVKLCVGDTATLSVEVVGDGPVSFQWFRDETAIIGATTQSFSIPNVSEADIATYHCEITNPCGSIQSTSATLGILDFDITITPGSLPMGVHPIVLNAERLCGESPVSFEWRDQDGGVVSQTQSLIVEPELNETSTFTVTATDNASMQASASVTVLVSENPNLTDPNGDGTNSEADFIFVGVDWSTDSTTFDADGDGSITVKDLAFVNGGE